MLSVKNVNVGPGNLLVPDVNVRQPITVETIRFY